MSLRTGIYNDPATGKTLSATINAAVTSMVYVGADTFAVGNIISLDSEWMAVTAINTGTKTLTIARGTLSVAASHAAGAAIGLVANLALYDVPNANNARLISAWGNALTALKYMVKQARKETEERNVNNAATAANATLATARDTERTAFEADWPQVV